jgi:hypothetical protein
VGLGSCLGRLQRQGKTMPLRTGAYSENRWTIKPVGAADIFRPGDIQQKRSPDELSLARAFSLPC